MLKNVRALCVMVVIHRGGANHTSLMILELTLNNKKNLFLFLNNVFDSVTDIVFKNIPLSSVRDIYLH